MLKTLAQSNGVASKTAGTLINGASRFIVENSDRNGATPKKAKREIKRFATMPLKVFRCSCIPTSVAAAQ